MITTDQILLSTILPLEPRESNLVLTGGTVKIETIQHYLNRVDQHSRYVGMEVTILQPPGSYSINDFLNHVELGNITSLRYRFNKLGDSGFQPIPTGESDIVIVNDLITGGVDYALSAAQGPIIKAMIEATQASINNKAYTNLIDTPNSYAGHKDKMQIVNATETGLNFIERTYIHDQGVPATTWNITHALDKYPSVTVKNSAGDTVEGFINFIDKNRITITFNSGFSGSAILN